MLKPPAAEADVGLVAKAFRTLALLLCALPAGCIVASSDAPPGLDAAVIHRSRATRAWSVDASGRRVGSVVRYDSIGEDERAVFIVRNAWGQDLGIVDALGRAWRRRPHSRELEPRGSGTVAEGVGRILECEESLVLREVELDDLTPAAPPPESDPETGT